MSQDPTKFDPKETTEAKLCAYVDGELDANGRAEIEKYLETNPQHRKLLKELTQTRELVRALPRTSAPADIGELLHGQLERSLLLNDLDSEPEADNMRISHAAQFRAVAAVILLAVGLGAIVYFVLPSSNTRVAVVGMPPAEREFPASAPHMIVPELEESTRGLADASAGATSAPVASPALVVVADADPFSRRGGEMAKTVGKAEDTFAFNRAESKVAETGGASGGFGAYAAKSKSAVSGGGGGAKQLDPFRSRVQQTMANASQGQSAANFTCVVVSTNDPVATKERVNTFLASNKIQWQPIAEPMPAPIQFTQSQIALSSRLNQTTVHLRRTDDINGQQKIGSNFNVVSNGEPQTPGTQALVGALPGSAPADAQYSLKAPAPSRASSAPTEVALEKRQVEQPTMDEKKDLAQAQIIEPLNLAGSAQQLREEGEHYIVARNMTTAQTVELKDLLSREAGPHTVEVFDASTIDDSVTQLRDLDKGIVNNSPTTAPSTNSLAAGVGRELNPAKRVNGKGFAGGPTTNVDAVATTLATTEALVDVQRAPVAATTQSVADADRLKLEPATQQTQDVVIVVRNDFVDAPIQQQAPVQRQAEMPAASAPTPATQQPAAAAAPVTAPSSTGPATQAAP